MKHSFYDYSSYDFVDRNAPIDTVTKCKHCSHNLGAQDCGNTCTHCRFITRELSDKS